MNVLSTQNPTNAPVFIWGLDMSLGARKDLDIPFELQEHKAIFSEEDSKDVAITLEGKVYLKQ